MKNWKRYFTLALLVCFAVTLVPIKAHADALTAGMIGSLAYAAAEAAGITFTAGNATGPGMSDFMAGQVESYVNEKGGSISTLFQGEAAITTAGKLLMAHNLYNGITTFIDWLGNKYNLGSTDSWLQEGSLMGTGIAGENTRYEALSEPTATGFSVVIVPKVYGSSNIYFYFYINGERKVIGNVSYSGWGNKDDPGTGAYSLYYDVNNILYAVIYGTCNGVTKSAIVSLSQIQGYATNENKISWNGSGYLQPQPLPENKQWEGDFSGTPGFAEPPTDLPDFLSKIPVGVADNNLTVTGQITEAETGGDPPFPSPSPSPQPGPSVNKSTIALIIAEIISVINSLTGDTAIPEEQIESIADSITESANTVPDVITQIGRETQTEIKDATTTITDTITETETQTQTEIKDATTTITDTITDTTTEIKDAIQDQTQTQEDIKDAIQDLTDVPQNWEPQKRPLPRGVFPFCIPFDLHDFILALSAEPQTPEIHVPFDLQLPLPGGNVLPFHYQFDLDLHDFDGLAQVLRTLEFIAFGVGLLFVTGKVIKW